MIYFFASFLPSLKSCLRDANSCRVKTLISAITSLNRTEPSATGSHGAYRTIAWRDGACPEYQKEERKVRIFQKRNLFSELKFPSACLKISVRQASSTGWGWWWLFSPPFHSWNLLYIYRQSWTKPGKKNGSKKEAPLSLISHDNDPAHSNKEKGKKENVNI